MKSTWCVVVRGGKMQNRNVYFAISVNWLLLLSTKIIRNLKFKLLLENVKIVSFNL